MNFVKPKSSKHLIRYHANDFQDAWYSVQINWAVVDSSLFGGCCSDLWPSCYCRLWWWHFRLSVGEQQMQFNPDLTTIEKKYEQLFHRQSTCGYSIQHEKEILFLNGKLVLNLYCWDLNVRLNSQIYPKEECMFYYN